jgi:hypothetical protein
VETRALIAFVLSISILVGYQLLLGPRPHAPAIPRCPLHNNGPSSPSRRREFPYLPPSAT